MSIPAFKLCTHVGASKAELERRTFTPEDEAVLTVRWNRARIQHDAWKEEKRIARDSAHGERRGRTRAEQAAFQILHAIETGQDQATDPYLIRSYWCRDHHLEPPSNERTDRLIGSAIRGFEEVLFAEIHDRLSENARTRLDALIDSETAVEDADDTPDSTRSAFSLMKSDPGRIGLASVQREVAKLNRIREIDLPDGLWADASPKLLERYRSRAATESIHELRRHSEPVRYTLLSAVGFLLAAPEGDHRWLGGSSHPGYPSLVGQGREARHCRDDRRSAARRRQDHPVVPHRRGGPRQSRRRGARGPLSAGGGIHLGRTG